MEYSRNNGNKGIDYLVNDDRLDISSLNNKQIIVVGERHGCSSDENLVRRLIFGLKPDYVLCEALGSYLLVNRVTKNKHLNLPVKEHYYEGFTKRWIQFSLEFNVPFAGMEYTKWTKEEHDSLSYVESFRIREAHFISMIDAFSKSTFGSNRKIIAICGDTHLRTVVTKELGPVSPLYVKYNNQPNSVVIRSQKGEIE